MDLRFSAVFILVFLGACGPKGPSDHFKSLDTGGDGEVDLDEWMSYYGPHYHPWQNCSGYAFENADCNGDLVLTWQEYYGRKFKMQVCEGFQDNPKIFRKPVLNKETGHYELVPPCELSANANTSSSQVLVASDSLHYFECD